MLEQGHERRVLWQRLVVLGGELLRDIGVLARDKDLGDTTLLLGHACLDHLCALPDDRRFKSGKDVVVERRRTTCYANADEALASLLVFEDPEWTPSEVFPDLVSVTLVNVVLSQCHVGLEDNVICCEFLFRQTRKIDLFLLSTFFIILRG